MADNTILNAGSGGDTIASDDISGVKFQRVKLALGADGVNDGDVASGNPLPVSGTVTANAGTGTMNVSVQNASIPVTDNAGSLTVDNNGTFAVQADTELPAAAALADGAANPTTPTVGAAGLVFNGTTWDRVESASVFDGNGATNFANVLAVKNVPKRINPANLGTTIGSTLAVDVTGSSTVTIAIPTSNTGTFSIQGSADNANWGSVECYDIFADLWISGQAQTITAGKVYSVLAGGMRQIRLRTETAIGGTGMASFWTLDNSQEFIAGIDTGPAPHNFGYTLFHKDTEQTTAQTGLALWTPTTGKKFVITDISISTGGTTAGIITLWVSNSGSGDTTFTAGTDITVYRAEFAPSTTSRPGVVKSFNIPYVSPTVDFPLRLNTSAAMTFYCQVNGYEI